MRLHDVHRRHLGRVLHEEGLLVLQAAKGRGIENGRVAPHEAVVERNAQLLERQLQQRVVVRGEDVEPTRGHGRAAVPNEMHKGLHEANLPLRGPSPAQRCHDREEVLRLEEGEGGRPSVVIRLLAHHSLGRTEPRLAVSERRDPLLGEGGT